MKISQMLKREDFYSINQKTLDGYYSESEKMTTLFIYPELNAIVTSKPSRMVKEYLRCEFTVRSNNPIKRIGVKVYVNACLSSFGIMAAKRMYVKGNINGDTLIYPCNKKYRIFDFESNTVCVVPKYGFPHSDLEREIEFRTLPGLPLFVPELICHGEHSYKEKIINGMPLARISGGFETYRDKAYGQMNEYALQHKETMPVAKYAEMLRERIEKMTSEKVLDLVRLLKVIDTISSGLSKKQLVELVFSHGDLQAGNIWVENMTGKIFIIDWESWGKRSIWYDKATLYQGLRPDGIEKYLQSEVPDVQKAIVVMEDIIFQLNELNNLPENYGCESFGNYLECIDDWIKANWRVGDKDG